MSDERRVPRDFEELRSSGLLWLINRVVFHPRGFALALVKRDDAIVGWQLQGDGSEVWYFKGPEDESFEAVAETLADAALRNGPITKHLDEQPDHFCAADCDCKPPAERGDG